MAKQLNVSLAFSADTSKAKAQIRDLQTELSKLASASTIGTFNNADMEQAIAAAKSLQTHLTNAVNVNTGRLDLSRFSKSLKGANQSLESLRKDLSLAGEQGNQAFLQLARSISQAEAPAIRISNTFREMGNTLKNTIRWQLSSSMLHGFMGAVQSAYRYAQDLDESLNNIRIVTGQNKEQMAEFAKEANKAAKALSTTTTAYTNAALIYYQQGDDDTTVLEKTDVTTKMANVTGQEASVVSDQLTAIWNNFNKAGEESYEKYADVLTALGAATASSTDEIAGGLEKFASIADMIGLSYEYAASALATITAKTRQSEDVVGTALKTIFARIQGLNLGETLEDGTDLNKYSDALMKVGISIKDQNGQLKDMDDILTEMGSKWETLSKDQQVALAQTVAGVRQYNQLVSLMDNWDFMQENLAISEGAEGTLSVQADIYAQSWEAASKRVQAATEDVFDSIIDSDFFISLTNGTADFISGIGDIIDAMGGMKGIITLVGSIFLTNFSKEIPSAIQKLTENFNVFTGKAQKDAIAMMEQNQAALKGFTSDNMTNALDAELTALTKVNEMKTSLAKTSHMLTEAERQQFEQEIQMVEAAGQLVAKEGEKVDAIEKEIAANERRLISEAARSKQSLDGSGPRISNLNGDKAQADEIRAKLAELKKLTQEYVTCEQVIKRLDIANATWLTSGEVSAKSMVKNMTVFKQSFIEARGGVDNLTDAEKQMCDTLEAEIKEANGDINKLKKAFENFGNGIKSSLNPVTFELLDKEIADIEQALRDLGVNNEALNRLEQQFREGAISADEYRQKLLALANTESQSVTHATKMSETIGFIGAKMMQVSMAANTLKQAWNIWSDEDATLGEKILTTMTALGTVIPIVTAMTNADNAAQMINHAINIANLGVKSKIPFVSKLCAAASAGLTAAKTGETGAVAANTAAWASNPIGWIAFAIMGVIAAIALLIAGLKTLTEWLIKGNKIETENCETLIENAEKTKELAEANEDLSSSMEDLIKEYKEMNAEGENTSEILSEIVSKMPQLIKSYKDLAETFGDPKFTEGVNELERLGNLANLTGDYSEFEVKKEELDKDAAIKTAQSAKTGAAAANTVLAAKMQETNGKAIGKSYSLRADGADTIGEEKKAQKILLTTMNSGDKKYATSDPGMFKYGVKVGISDYSDPLEMVDYYEKMQKARDEMLNAMSVKELEKSDIFREINETLAATASEYQAAKEQADEYLSVAGKAAEASMGSTKDIDTMEEYLEYKEKFIQVATKEYNLTQDQAESYLKSIDGLKGLTNQYELAGVMAEKFSGIDLKSQSDEGKAFVEEYYKIMSESFGELSEQEIEIAVAVASTSDSFEEFAQQLQLRIVQATQAGAATSADLASQAMKESLDKNEIDFSKLFIDDNFLEYLKTQQISQQALLSASYEEQYRIVSGFHGAMNELAFESFTTQQELYYQQAADLQQQSANYHKTMQENSEAVTEAKKKYADFQTQLSNTTDEGKIKDIKDQMKELADQFEENYGFEITSNTESFQNELDQILATIEQIQDKKIELAMDWSGVDELESGLKRASDFTKMVKNDAKKVGDTYQMTAAQAREWLEFYPELGAIAEVTTDGLISMDVDKVNNFLNGKEAELDGSVQTEIEKLKVEREGLQAELEIRKADLKSAEALAQGKLDLEDTSAEYLTTLRSNLTQYYMDLGLDEVAANAAALETMNMNEEEYSKAVANACETNATNVGQSAEDGANAQVDALGQLVQKWQSFGTYLKDNIGSILKEIGLAILDPTRSIKDVMLDAWNASGPVSVDSGSSYSGASGGYTFKSGDQAQITAALQAVSRPQLDGANAAITELENAISAIDGKIQYLNALGTQNLEFLGVTDPDDINKVGEALEDLAERYHEITREITAQEHALDQLSKQKDKAYGKNKLKYIEQEIAGYENLYEEQNKLYLLRLANLALDQQNLQSAFNGKVDFNTDTNEINNFTNLYNSATEEQRELLEEYEKSVDALRDQENVLWDIADTLQSLQLEQITVEVDSEIEINQRDLDKLDYTVDKLSRNLNTMIEQIDALGQQVGNYDKQSQAYRQGIDDIKANAAAQGRALTADEIKQIQAYEDALLDINGALMDLVETVENSVLEEFERLGSEIDDNISRFDTYNSMLDHYSNIIKLSGRQTKDSMLLMELSAQKTNTALQKLNASRDKYLAYQSTQSDVKSKLDDAIASGNEADIKYWQEQYDEITKAVEESHDEMLASWEETLQAAGDQFDLAIESTIQTLKDSISEFGLEGLSDRYSKAAEEQDRFLSNLDKEYELNKLNREISGKIDETDNIKAKQKLLELQDEINEKLASGEQMSKYDLEHLQKKYDLELAKIALEEAQNAKSTVRLQRDSEGNFGYVYTADQDKVDDAQQNYEDKLYNLKKHSEEYLDEMSQAIIQNQEEMMEALAAVDRTKFDTQEEYEAELNRIKEYYMGRDIYYRKQMQNAMDELNIAYQDTLLGQLEGSASLDEAQQVLQENTNNATTAMGEAWQTWHNSVNQSMTEAGTSSATFTEDIKADAEEIGTATENLAGVIDTQTTNMVDYMGRLVEAVQDWRDEYIAAIDDIISKNEELAEVQEVAFDKHADYSALINEYLNSGGKVGDKTFNALMEQREAKIDWLIEEEGKDASYYGKRGQDAIDMYKELESGGGDQEWFTADYIQEGELEKILTQLNIPFDNLDGSVDEVKTSTDNVGNTIIETGAKTDSNNNSNNEKTAENINTAASGINQQTQQSTSTLDGQIKTQGESTIGKLTSIEDQIKNTIIPTTAEIKASTAEIKAFTAAIKTSLGENIGSTLNTRMILESDKIVTAVEDVSREISNLSSEVSSLTRVTVGSSIGGAIGSFGGPIGSAIGEAVGSLLGSFDTGGYTGEWGPEGKMAILHEKEIVLNQNDTNNLLNTIDVVRDIMNMIDSQASMASLFNLTSSYGAVTQNDTLEQNVTIHAEFPNATNHNEIEEAFNNLVNRASQYVNRK